MVIRYLVAVSFAWALAIGSAQADDIKTLVKDALQNGSSEGVLDGNVAKVFTGMSKSNEPVKVHIKRIEKFSRGCGRLHFDMEQGGIKDDKGNAVTIHPWFELNLCPDGDPPLEKINEERAREKKALDACHVLIEKGGTDKDTGAQHAFIRAAGCPANGLSHWRYDGDCAAMQMPPKMVTNTPITKDGKINIELLVPVQCLSKHNVWNAWVREPSGQAIGQIKAIW